MECSESEDTKRAWNQALILLEDRVIGLGGQEIKTYGLPEPDRTQQVGDLTVLCTIYFYTTNF